MPRASHQLRYASAAIVAVLVLLVFPATASAQERPCFAFDRDVVIAAGNVNRCALIIVNGDVTVEPDATQEGAITVANGNVFIDEGAFVDGNVAVTDGDVEVLGAVEGQVFAENGRIGPQAEIGGDVRVLGELTVADGATIHGAVSEGFFALPEGDGDSLTDRYLGKTVSGLSLVIFSVLFALLAVVVAPGAVANIRDCLRGGAGASLGVGILALVIAPVLYIVLAPTVVALVLLPIVYLAAVGVGAVGLGERIGGRLWSSASRRAHAALGTGLLAVVTALSGAAGAPVLCLASVVGAFVAAWLIGATVLTLFGARPFPRQPSAPEPAPGAPSSAAVAEGTPDSSVPPTVPVDDEASWGASRQSGSELQEGEPTGQAGFEAVDTSPADLPEAAEADAEADEEGARPTPGWGWSEAREDSSPSQPPATPGPAPTPKEPSRGLELQQVPGITPVFSQLLREAGIRTLDDLASSTPETVAEIISVPGVLPVGIDTAGAWIRQARDILGR